MNREPYWYKLIFYWVKNRKRDGLTIPFILGAKKEIGGTESVCIEDIDQLLKEIINYSNDENIVTLSYCDSIGENVLGLIGRVHESYYSGKPFVNQGNGKISLLVGSGLQLGTTVEDIIETLKSKYRSVIEKRTFFYQLFELGTF